MILVLTGKAASGKDTILKELTTKFMMSHIKSHTTRPMRPGEQNGREYCFVSLEEYMEMHDRRKFGIERCYDVTGGQTWWYGVLLETLRNTKDGVLIIDPNGLALLKLCYPEIEVTAFYIHANEDVIHKRLEQRGDNPEEAKRRLEADNDDFENIMDWCDYAIVNNGGKSPTMIANEIRLIYETQKRLKEQENGN